MSDNDRQKWDAKYADAPLNAQNGDPSHLLAFYHSHAPGILALDVACGTGRNALFLAHHGFNVDALDISSVGLAHLEKQTTQSGKITCQNVDLDTYTPPSDAYDLIIVANYLNRPLIPKLAAALRNNGILIIDTFMDDARNTRDGFNPDYRLKDNELPGYFCHGFDILKYRVYCDNSGQITQTSERWKQAIVVKRVT